MSSTFSLFCNFVVQNRESASIDFRGGTIIDGQAPNPLYAHSWVIRPTGCLVLLNNRQVSSERSYHHSQYHASFIVRVFDMEVYLSIFPCVRSVRIASPRLSTSAAPSSTARRSMSPFAVSHTGSRCVCPFLFVLCAATEILCSSKCCGLSFLAVVSMSENCGCIDTLFGNVHVLTYRGGYKDLSQLLCSEWCVDHIGY